jgi:hypothetical protein
MLDENTTECCPRCGTRCPIVTKPSTRRRTGLYCYACDRWFVLTPDDA